MLATLILIALLGAPRFATRAVAMHALHPLQPHTLPFLLHAEKHSPDAEVRGRASWLLSRYYQANADTLSRQLTDVPPIRFLPWWWSYNVRDGAQQLACNYLLHWVDGFSWPYLCLPYEAWRALRYQVATRCLLRDRIAARLDVQGLLEQMRIERQRQKDEVQP